eukprot:Partr_v1_DN25492_c0_g1_i1_m53635 putative Splicing factor 3A subunit
MDRQNRVGSRPGAGGVASASDANVDRRERLRQLAMDTIDLANDPYLMKNHLGRYECKLCLTLHTNEGSYMAHTQAKKHQANLARRAAKESRSTSATMAPFDPSQQLEQVQVRRNVVKIGRPGYRITKIRDPHTRQLGLLFQMHYPQIDQSVIKTPHHRFMSAYEQRVEIPNRAYQYLLFAAEPYETVAFRVPALELDKRNDGADGMWHYWDSDARLYSVQILFRPSSSVPGVSSSVLAVGASV